MQSEHAEKRIEEDEKEKWWWNHIYIIIWDLVIGATLFLFCRVGEHLLTLLNYCDLRFDFGHKARHKYGLRMTHVIYVHLSRQRKVFANEMHEKMPIK